MRKEVAMLNLEKCMYSLDGLRAQRQAWVNRMSALLDNPSVSKRDILSILMEGYSLLRLIKKWNKSLKGTIVFFENRDAESYNILIEASKGFEEEYIVLNEYCTNFKNMSQSRLADSSNEIGGSSGVSTYKEPKRRARGSYISKLSQRIFICWDRKSVMLREQLEADILSQDIGVDCVVSYYDAYQKTPEDEIIKNELRDTQLVVLLVSQLFFDKNDKEEFRDYRMAKELKQNNDLAILPIVVNDSLFDKFTKSERAIHGIAMNAPEYRKKLGEQLHNFIINIEMVQEISKKAFSSRLFLSYRKKDIDYARTLINAFHNIFDLEHVAIWYDNYLTAGRTFDKEINNAIDKADVFMVLVTPTLFELNDKGEKNYVLAQEIPYAIETGKKIVAVEVLPVDRAMFERECHTCEAYLTMDNINELSVLLDKKLSVFKPNDEQTYLLGMAYKYKILVEHNKDRAIRLFETLSESDNTWGIESNIERIRLLEESNLFSYNSGLLLWGKVIEIQKKVIGENHPDVAKSLANLANIYHKNESFKDALHYYKKSLSLNEKLFGSNHASVAINYRSIGDICISKGDYEDALSYYQKALAIRVKERKESAAAAHIYNDIANVYKLQGDYERAFDFHKKAYEIYKKDMGAKGFKTVETLEHIADLYSKQGNNRKAQKLYQQISKMKNAL